MVTSAHYPNAPITEAIIELKVDLPEDIGKTDLAKMQVDRRAEYPQRREMKLGHAEMNLAPAVSASAMSEFLGFSFKSNDEQRIFQARRDGFALSRLAPYESWPPFRDEARHLWTEFRDRFEPSVITRLAVRYVNRIDIPVPLLVLEDYLRTSPNVSMDLPCAQLSNFFLQLTIPQNDLKSVLLINEAIVDPAREDHISVALDIDIFRSQDVPQDETDIWAFFESLHERKNAVFEASITDKVRELIK